MELTINGEVEEISEPATVGDLLRRFDIAPIRAAVEVNQDLVTRAEFDYTCVHNGDTVEIVTFVGGG